MTENILFEYNSVEYTETAFGNKKVLKETLNNVWKNLIKKPDGYKYKNYSDTENEEPSEDLNTEEEKKQRFITFTDTHIKPNNYIGFIQNGDKLIEIYPKIFYTKETENFNKNLCLQHIFYWLSYCNWLPARIDNTQQSHKDIDSFPDFLIFYIASLIKKAVSEQPYSCYEEVEEVLYAPKGRINFNSYINNGLSHGNWHQIDCVYEPFMYDNRVNQIIKDVTKRMRNYTKYAENHKLLNDILFVLDEVQDRNCSSDEIDRIKISDFFNEYKDILYWCKLILDQQLFDNTHNNDNTFCFLLPMEKIFEGFVAGMMQECLNIKVETQNSNAYLITKPENVFQLRTDIEAKINNKEYIIDTKYKIRKCKKDDEKQGVSQADMYQMIAYSIRKEVTEFILFYPDCKHQMHKHQMQEETTFKVIDEFAKKHITIQAINLPIIDKEDIRNIKSKLKHTFEEIFNQLKKQQLCSY